MGWGWFFFFMLIVFPLGFLKVLMNNIGIFLLVVFLFIAFLALIIWLCSSY